MKTTRWYVFAIYFTIFSLVIWLFFTLWGEIEGPKNSWTFGVLSEEKPILIVYDPDPFYNLDEQVCRAFGQALADVGLHGTVTTVAGATGVSDADVAAYVLCANTYNWRPDWSIASFVRRHQSIKAKPVVAITLGSGSTESAQKAFEKIINKRQGMLIGSKSIWLLRPNNEKRLKEANADVAREMAYEWALELSDELRGYVKRDSL